MSSVHFLCCRRGLTARQLYTELSQADFEQQGGMLAVALPSSPAMPSVTAEIFSRCVLAHLRV